LRNQRLAECVEVMRALFAGEEVSHEGLVTVDRARLWTRPEEPPPFIGAAVSASTAGWVAGWADGLVTVNQPVETLREVVAAYREAGGTGPAALQVHVSYDPDEERALAIAHDQWRNNVVGPPVAWNLETMEEFDTLGQQVEPDDVRGSVLVSNDPKQHAAWLAELIDV